MKREVAIVMGSISDWNTMKEAAEILENFGVNYDKKVISAHRMPKEMFAFSETAKDKGLKAGGAAHLPGMVAANTILPVIGVPVKSRALNGMDSLLSIVQMPAGIPVATTAIGASGAKNAALLALQILGINDEEIAEKLVLFRKKQHDDAEKSGEQLG